jgi:hypothetical protein
LASFESFEQILEFIDTTNTAELPIIITDEALRKFRG